MDIFKEFLIYLAFLFFFSGLVLSDAMRYDGDGGILLLLLAGTEWVDELNKMKRMLCEWMRCHGGMMFLPYYVRSRNIKLRVKDEQNIENDLWLFGFTRANIRKEVRSLFFLSSLFILWRLYGWGLFGINSTIQFTAFIFDGIPDFHFNLIINNHWSKMDWGLG